MSRLALACLLGLGIATSAAADMTVKQSTSTVTEVNPAAIAVMCSPCRPATRSRSEVILTALRSSPHVVAVELRPPRAELEASAGMDAWIDTYHAIRGLVRQDVRVMVTDSAVGAQEENNLRHLVNNLGPDVPRSRVVPFLTTKHSLEFCLAYADQVVQHGFPALVVLGGDKHVGRARSVEHAWQLRQLIRERHRAAAGRLGESARRSGAAGRVPGGARLHGRVLPDADRLAPRRRSRRSVPERSRSARRDGARDVRCVLLSQRETRNPRVLQQFLPVPVDGAARPSSRQGRTPEEVCARSIRALIAWACGIST